MKKTYEAPSVEKIAFQYRDQVVAASNGSHICQIKYTVENDECVKYSEVISSQR